MSPRRTVRISYAPQRADGKRGAMDGALRVMETLLVLARPSPGRQTDAMAGVRRVVGTLVVLVRPSPGRQMDVRAEVRRVVGTLFVLAHMALGGQKHIIGIRRQQDARAGALHAIGALLVLARPTPDSARPLRVIGTLLILSGMAGLLPSSQLGVPLVRTTASPQLPSPPLASESEALDRDVDSQAAAWLEFGEPTAEIEPSSEPQVAWSAITEEASAEWFDGEEAQVGEWFTDGEFQEGAWATAEDPLESE